MIRRSLLAGGTVLTVLALAAFQQAITARTAAQRVGSTVVVEDTVAELARPQGSAFYYLNFGAPYPQQVLTATVPATLAPSIPGLTRASGAVVQLRGTVIQGPDGPTIECSSTDQLRILTAGTAATTAPTPAPTQRACCRICTTGKACGNSCIARNRTCRQPPGCACNG